MEIYEAIKKRKTCRDWQNKDVPLNMIKKIMEAGLKAPTHNHLREWECIVLHTPQEKEKALHLGGFFGAFKSVYDIDNKNKYL